MVIRAASAARLSMASEVSHKAHKFSSRFTLKKYEDKVGLVARSVEICPVK